MSIHDDKPTSTNLDHKFVGRLWRLFAEVAGIAALIVAIGFGLKEHAQLENAQAQLEGTREELGWTHNQLTLNEERVLKLQNAQEEIRKETTQTLTSLKSAGCLAGQGELLSAQNQVLQNQVQAYQSKNNVTVSPALLYKKYNDLLKNYMTISRANDINKLANNNLRGQLADLLQKNNELHVKLATAIPTAVQTSADALPNHAGGRQN